MVKKSIATAGALLQSIIARAADYTCYVVMASLDLSMYVLSMHVTEGSATCVRN